MDGLVVELKRAKQRQGENLSCTLTNIDKLMDQLEQTKQQLQVALGTGPELMDVGQPGSPPATNPPDGGAEDHGALCAEALGRLHKECQALKPLEAVGVEHKTYHAAISKLCKAVEKALPSDVEKMAWAVQFDRTCLHEVIAKHLYRRGAFRAAESFSQSTGLAIPAQASHPLQDIHGAVQALRKRSLDPAERWARVRREGLAALESPLELQLASLRFVQILQRPGQNQRQEAVAFAQDNFPRFCPQHMGAIQRLMGCLMWPGRLLVSPYADLASDDRWAEACHALVRDGCTLAGLPQDNTLAVIFQAGVTAIPTLIKMAGVVQSSNRDWNSLQELPVEIPLPRSMQFHSIFSCPVSRELSSKENPPLLLKCGHVICQSSVQRLSAAKNGQRFKCPTCPTEQLEKECMPLHL